MARYADVPLLEICAKRKGGTLKKRLQPLFKIIPNRVLIKLREHEMKSSYHERKNERMVSFDCKSYQPFKDAKRVLLVDDSIDSGNSIIEVKKVLQQFFVHANIEVAVFNVMSKATVRPNYYLYEDTMIKGPWSNDSKENKVFLSLYQNWKKSLLKFHVSVAMATYNGSDFIEEQISSILSNLGPEDELIISDDGSTDGTLKILKEFEKKDSRIRLVMGPQKGVIKNFENALHYCTGKYIFLSDQDDVWTFDKRKTIVGYFQKKDVLAVVHDATVVDEKNNVIMDSWFKHRNSSNGFFRNIIKNRYLGCCMAFDRKLLEYALPIPDDIEMHDWWLGLCAELYGKTMFVPEKLLQYRRHSKNVSSLKHYGYIKMFKNRYKLLYRLWKLRKNS